MSEPDREIRLPLAPGRSLALAVLYEDEAVLALGKPSGLMVSPDTCDREKPNLMSALRRALDTDADWVRARGLSYLANVHRLDADTSGVLLLAKTREALRALAQQFNDRSALYLSQLKPHYKQHPDVAERPLLGRLALHAHRLALSHPLTGRRLELESPLPNDFAVALKYLRKFAQA
ncbi:MAG: hypothetical protein FJ388_05770 [Verrucomicrobia bacterium]|nr:hypothetical protein [Verrucomicrobiota bacterium]